MTREQIEAITIEHPVCHACRFVAVRQDGREYYRLVNGLNGGGSLTTKVRAEETIAYWRAKGWAPALPAAVQYARHTCSMPGSDPSTCPACGGAA